MFENFGIALLNKCHDVLIKFPGEIRLNFNLEAIYSQLKRCATYGTPCTLELVVDPKKASYTIRKILTEQPPITVKIILNS